MDLDDKATDSLIHDSQREAADFNLGSRSSLSLKTKQIAGEQAFGLGGSLLPRCSRFASSTAHLSGPFPPAAPTLETSASQ